MNTTLINPSPLNPSPVTLIRPYWPLMTVILLAIALPRVMFPALPPMAWMNQAMGFFMVLLAMLKIFDLRGFRRGFAKYDVVTQIWPTYGLLYPFVELGLGLLLLGGVFLIPVYAATIVVMAVGLTGIIRATSRGQKLTCACMGNVLSVPLSTVSKVENGGMIVMSVLMLAHYLFN